MEIMNHAAILNEERINEMLEVIMMVARGDFSGQIKLSEENDIYDALGAGINMMIDDLRYSSEKVEEEQEYTRNILASIIDVLIVMDNDRKIKLLNPAGLSLLEYDAAELSGKELGSLFGVQEQVLDEQEFQILKDTDAVKNLERTIRTKSGRGIPVLLSVSMLRSKNGAAEGYIAMARDITESKLLEEKQESMRALEKVNKELDQFAYIVSHDLKAPLRAITNLSMWIEEDIGPGLTPDSKRNLDLLRSRVQRMETLISGILEYSKVGRITEKAETVDVNDLVKEVLEMLVPPPTFAISIPDRMPVLVTQRVKLQQVFSNLISNAIKYHDTSKGMITIGYTQLGDRHEFYVQDDGPGIDPRFHGKVFQIFQTLESRDKVEGTGIGLSIVQKIVGDNSGTIRLESERGKGAKFIFTWK